MTTLATLALAAHPGHGHTPADTAAHYSELDHLGGSLVLAIVVFCVVYAVITAIRDAQGSRK